MLNLGLLNSAQSYIWGNMYNNPLGIGLNFGNPMQSNQGLEDVAASWGRSLFDRQLVTIKVARLKGMESQISLSLKSDKLDESQKQRLQDLLDQVKALKEKAQKTIAKQDFKSEEIDALISEIEELEKNSTQVVNEITEELSAAAAEAENADSSDGAGDADGADGTDGTDGTAATGATGATGTSDGAYASDATEAAEAAEAKKNEKAKKDLAYAMEKICDRIDGAVRGAFTNYDDDENGIKNILKNEINKDNVLELFAAWDRTYKGQGCYSGGDDEYGLIGTLMNDCEGSQKEEIAMLLINALEDKAHELGIDVSKEVTKAKMATHGNWYVLTMGITVRDDDEICQAVNALYEKVKLGVRTHEIKVIGDVEKKKVEKAKAEAKKVQDQKTRFRDAMRYALDDDKAEISSDVRYENNKFVITIHGEDYYGKNYKELVKALEKDGLDPAQHLKQKALNKTA